MSGFKDLHNFLHAFGLGAAKAEEDIYQNHEKTQAFFSQRRERVIYCMGCGKPLVSGGKTDADKRSADGERQMSMHMVCYQNAIEEMRKIKRDVNYNEE